MGNSICDTGGPVVGLVEWIAIISGMEKGMFLPSVSSFSWN